MEGTYHENNKKRKSFSNVKMAIGRMMNLFYFNLFLFLTFPNECELIKEVMAAAV